MCSDVGGKIVEAGERRRKLASYPFHALGIMLVSPVTQRLLREGTQEMRRASALEQLLLQQEDLDVQSRPVAECQSR